MGCFKMGVAMNINKSIADLVYTDVLDIDVGTEFECADGFAELRSKSQARNIPERRYNHPELRRQTSLAGDYEVLGPAMDIVIPASVEGVFDVEVITPELRAMRNRPGPDEIQEQIDFIRWVVGADSVATPAAPEPAPENHFADLMLADETIDDARERLSQRLRELRHYLIAPEIKVNEDGSVGLTAGEQAELADLERRQTMGRWLEA